MKKTSKKKQTDMINSAEYNFKQKKAIKNDKI